MTKKIIEIERCFGMETNVEKTKVNSISRQPPPLRIIIDRKQAQNVKHFEYVGSTITNDARYTRDIKSSTVMAKAAFNKKKNLFISKFSLSIRKVLVKCCIWGIALKRC
jgi:hypothetical protein